MHRALERARRGESGFTIVEMMVAMMIFMIMITGIATMMSSTLNITRNNRNRSIAANLAAEEMDTVRTTTFTDLPLGRIVTTQDVDGVAYTVTRDTEWITEGATGGACRPETSDTDLAFLRVTVFVEWPNMTGVQPPTSSTIVTPPVGTYDTNTGHVAVEVINRDGGPQEGVDITLSNTSGFSETQTTTEDGCAFFAYKSAGAYTLTATAAGFVDDQANDTVSQAVTVVVGATAAAQFVYGQAATLDLTLDGEGSGIDPPDDVPVTLGNTHFVPAGTRIFTGSGNPREIESLFPWLDGYDVWLGECADADPLSFGVARNHVATTAGGTSTVTVHIHELEVWVEDSGGSPVQGAAVQVVHPADALCPLGETFSLGTTDASGLATMALPFGTWEVWVDGLLGDTVTLDPTAGSIYSTTVVQ
jgi:type II secretory pathway pseudopilin PulG